MKYLGDFLPGEVVDFKFNTHSAAGAPITLAGSPSLAAYKDNGTTEDADGITLTVDFDSKTGLHHVRITTATDLTFYSVGGKFQIWIVAGTVDGSSVVGTVLAEFSVARSLDIIGFTGLGFLSGTHSTTTADLGTNAPSRSMVGKWLRIPTRDVSSYISAHNTGTGVVTFNPATAETLADGDLWFIIDVPYLPTDVALMPSVNLEAVGGSATDVSALATNVAAILVDTGTTLDAKINTIDDLLDTELPALTTAVADLPTNAELATALGTADDAVLSAIAAVSTKVDTVDDLLDTELPALTTAVADIPTNAELATALGTADDAVLSAIAAVSTKVDAVDDLLDTELPALTTAVADIPTNAELATALGTADDAVLAQIALVKATTDKIDDTLEDDAGTYRFTANALEQGPSGGGGVADWTADERTALRSILGIPASGTTPADPSTGILDTIRDAVGTRSSQTSVDDIPTNAELATALGTADDAVLSAVAAVSAKIDTVDDLLDTELPALTTAVADIPTNAELATALGTADDAVLAAISALNNLSTAQLASAIAAGDDATLAAIAALNNVSVANILAATVEGSTTLVQSLRLINAAMGGKASGLATTEVTYRDLADTKDRIVATVDADGNRSVVTRDLT